MELNTIILKEVIHGGISLDESRGIVYVTTGNPVIILMEQTDLALTITQIV